MVGVATWACRWRELRPISFGTGGGVATGIGEGTQSEEARREEYEMVPVKDVEAEGR